MIRRRARRICVLLGRGCVDIRICQVAFAHEPRTDDCQIAETRHDRCRTSVITVFNREGKIRLSLLELVYVGMLREELHLSTGKLELGDHVEGQNQHDDCEKDQAN